MSFYKTVIGCFDKYFSTQSKCLHEVNFAFYFSTSAPSSAPTNFTVTASSPSVITASWQFPPADSRNGIITGYKLFHKRKNSGAPADIITINSGATHTTNVSGLIKYTEYEFQVLAFTSVGDGPKSSVKVMRTVGDGMKLKHLTVYHCASLYIYSGIIECSMILYVRWVKTNSALTKFY